MLLLNPYMNKLVKKDLENNSIINTNLIESITNFETIKGLNIEAKIIDKLEYLYSKNLKNALKFSNIINFCISRINYLTSNKSIWYFRSNKRLHATKHPHCI